MPDQCCSLHPVITGWRLLWHGANTSWPWSITVPLCMDVWLLRMPSSKGLEARSDGSKAGCPSQRSACHNRVPIENDAMLMRSPAPACIAAWPREFAKSFFWGVCFALETPKLTNITTSCLWTEEQIRNTMWAQILPPGPERNLAFQMLMAEKWFYFGVHGWHWGFAKAND